MEPPPSNPFSGSNSGDANNDGNTFDAFSLSPVVATESSPMPSLQSIQQQEQRQMQQRQTSAMPAAPQQLRFESLPSPGDLSGPMNDASGSWPPPPPNNYDDERAKNDGRNANDADNGDRSFLAKLLTCGGICSVEALRPYFDVDTADVLVRMKGSLRYCMVADGFRDEVLYSDNALKSARRGGSEADAGGGAAGEDRGGMAGSDDIGGRASGGGDGGKGPDLYGPVWITLTLVFFVAVTSNMSLYVHHSRSDKKRSIVDEGGIAAEEEWDYDINQLLRATWILYSFSIGLPSLLYFVLRLLAGGRNRLGLAELICLYGYSLVPYLPVVWLCVLSSGGVQWLFLAVATALSGMLVLRNVAGVILESSGGVGGMGVGGVLQSKGGALIPCLVGCHFVFFLVMKFAFYHHT